MMGNIRWGILSTANIALTQVLPAIQRSENGKVLAIASESGKAKKAAEEYNIPKAYDSYEALLRDPEIDAVYMPLPNHLHKKWVVEAARSGKHILCEKPAALTQEETKEMINTCGDHGVTFMEAFMYQFHPQHKRVREIIQSGEIGDVKLMRSSFSFYLDDRETNIRAAKEKGGGSLYDVGCYSIHAIRNILGAEPVEVSVQGVIDPERKVDLSAFGYLKFENGIQASFDCSFDMAFRHEYEVVGTKGKIHVPRAFRTDVDGGEGLVIVQTEKGIRTEQLYGDIYELQVSHFAQAILENKEPIYRVDNTLQNMRVIDWCNQSMEQKGPITVSR
ncbi:Gfo/Idh/MocA family oxidoreductase [Mesobacillus foraminis]|uniref:Gfo/Idh/MocA family protein n=1 Tax=Mesobacillus foraminis TaxID=279826 RepID=UPI001BE52130|nr:Gfo/Idh/MocA family oxidoreductase [Mesobacillus foraminis]MBT2758366.1 Gfo/Idh/MocA family oxidoreductase [Mesobacillus foraminis]